MIKIALVDDHTLFRNGLKGLLSANSHYTVVGEFSDGSQLIAALPALDVDVVLILYHAPQYFFLQYFFPVFLKSVPSASQTHIVKQHSDSI